MAIGTETNPRWAPDGNKIAYISNAEGNANLLVQEIPSGASRELNLRNRKHSPDWALLQIYPGDETKTEYARISVTDERGSLLCAG